MPPPPCAQREVKSSLGTKVLTSSTRISEAAVDGDCLCFPDHFFLGGGQKVKNNESVLKISFQQQKLARRHNCCNIGLYWYKNISHRAAETV